MKYVYGKKMKTLKDRLTTGVAALALLTNSIGMSLPFILTQRAAAAGETINISTAAELRSAIENQDDDQVWNIQAGNYAVTPTSAVTADGRVDWYFPIVKNNITINGIGNPTVYGDGFAPNGIWQTQNLVSVFGDNVTINGVTLMPKVQPNKTIEVLGSNFTLKNTVFAPNTLVDNTAYDNIANADTRAWAKQWGGSLYFNHEGNHTIENVTIKNGGVAYRLSPAGTHINFTNVSIVNATANDSINSYRHSTHFEQAGSSVTGEINIIYNVNSTLGNMDSVLNAINGSAITAPSTIILDSDLSVSSAVRLSKPLVFDGNGYAITAAHQRSNAEAGVTNTAMTILSSDVTVKNLTINATHPVDPVHGIVIHAAPAPRISSISLENLTVHGATLGVNINNNADVAINGIHTSGSRWGGVSIFNGSTLDISGVNSHSEPEPIPFLYTDHKDTVTVEVNGLYDIVRDEGQRVEWRLAAPADTTAPLVTINNPAANAAVNGVIDVLGTVTDDQELSHYTLYLYPGSTNLSGGGVPAGWISVPGWQQANTSADHIDVVRTLDTSALDDGEEYQIRLAARDAAGNRNTSDVYNGGTSSVHVVRFTVDRTVPEAPTNLHRVLAGGTVIPCGAAIRPQVVTPTWTASTSGDIAYYEYSSANPDGTPGLNKRNLGNVTSFNTGGWMPTNGTGTYFLRAVDNAGNASGWVSCSVTYDNSRPTVNIDSFNLSGSTLEVNVSGTDTYSGLLALGINIYDESNSGSPLIGGLGRIKNNIPMFTLSDNASRAGIDISSLAPGTYTIRAVALDHAGNYSLQDLETFTIEEDPGVTLPQFLGATYMEDDIDGLPRSSGDNTYIRDFIFTLTGSEDTVRYQLKYWNDIPGSPFKVDSPWNPTDGSWSGHMGPLGTYTDLFTQGYGVHYFSFSACDADNNCSEYGEPFVITYLEDNGPVQGCDTETCPDTQGGNNNLIDDLTGGNVLGLNDGLTNTGTQNGGLLVLIAAGLMAIALASLRRKQEN